MKIKEICPNCYGAKMVFDSKGKRVICKYCNGTGVISKVKVSTLCEGATL